MTSARRFRWSFATLVTAALALSLLGAGPGAATDESGAAESGAAPQASTGEAEKTGEEGSLARGVIVKTRDQVGLLKARSAVEMLGEDVVSTLGVGQGIRSLVFDELVPLAEAQRIADTLEQRPDIEWAEPDSLVALASSTSPVIPNDTSFERQWNLWDGGGASDFSVRAPLIWGESKGTKDVVVAVIDSGIVDHPDLRANVVPGYDFVATIVTSNDGDGRDADATDPGSWVSAEDVTQEPFIGFPPMNSTWHGTAMASLIAAVNGNSRDISGVAPGVRIQPVRVTGKGDRAFRGDLAAGVTWASGGKVPGVPDNPTPADVINISITGSAETCPLVYATAIAGAISRGTTVVASAGNDNESVTAKTPANCDGVIAVTATDRFGQRANYANFGTARGDIDIAAPGGDQAAGDGVVVLSDRGTKEAQGATTQAVQGTSAAAPHVAGAAALLHSMGVTDPAAVRARLLRATRPFPATGGARDCTALACGAGILDLGRLKPPEWGTPIRLGSAWSIGSPQTGVERGSDFAVSLDGQGNGVALAAMEVTPQVDAEGRVPTNSMVNVVMRYVDGVWQEPEVIQAPFSATGVVTPGDGSYSHGPVTVSVSDDGYAAIAMPGMYYDANFTKQYGVFLSTSHDITQPGSFTPWQRVSGPSDVLELFQRVPLAVGAGGHLVLGYFVRTLGWPHPEITEGCFGGSYARTGLISKDRAVLSTPRIMARCLPPVGDNYARTPIDVAVSGSTATVAYVDGTLKCGERAGSPIPCSRVDLATFDTRSATWSPAVGALPQQAHESATESRGLAWYEHVRVAASSGGTAVVGRLNSPSQVLSIRYINIPAGTVPDPDKRGELTAQDTWYYPSDVVIAADGTALAAFDVDSCDTYNYPYCEGLKRTFRVLEFTPTSAKTHDLYGPTPTNWTTKWSNRIAMSLPSDAPLSQAVIAYTATAAPRADGILGPGWIETRAWPFAGSSPERLPAPKGYGTALGAWPWSGPAVAASATGAGLLLYRPDWEASDGIGTAAASEVWASGLDTANQAGVFPPVHVKASVNADKRAVVSGIRPFFYPEGGGEEAFFNRGAQPRAKMEVLVATGPPGYRVTDTPVCTTTYSRDDIFGSRIGSTRGRASCTITAALPSGTYTFTARTTLDGKTSARSLPTAPVVVTGTTTRAITLNQPQAIGKGSRIKFRITGVATGFTADSTLTVWVRAGNQTQPTRLGTIRLGAPDARGRQTFTYTSKGRHPKPIAVYLASQDGTVVSTTRTIQ